MSKKVDKAELEQLQIKSLHNKAILINGFKNIYNSDALSLEEFEFIKYSLMNSSEIIYFVDNEVNEYLESVKAIKQLYNSGLITDEELVLIKRQMLSQITFCKTLAEEYVTTVNKGFLLLKSNIFSDADFIKTKKMALYRCCPEILNSDILNKPIYAFIELLFNSGYSATASSIKSGCIKIIMVHPTYPCNPIYIKWCKLWFTGRYSRKVKDKQGNKFKNLSILRSYLQKLKL